MRTKKKWSHEENGEGAVEQPAPDDTKVRTLQRRKKGKSNATCSPIVLLIYGNGKNSKKKGRGDQHDARSGSEKKKKKAGRKEKGKSTQNHAKNVKGHSPSSRRRKGGGGSKKGGNANQERRVLRSYANQYPYAARKERKDIDPALPDDQSTLPFPRM